MRSWIRTGGGISANYGYDVLDNLTSVTQAGQVRRFGFDGVGELTSASNPESGTVTYGYDAAGNMAGQTDARGIAVRYSYDELNRMTSETASDHSVQTTWNYDAGAYGIGRLSSVTTPNTSYAYGYDGLGRVTSSTQGTGAYSYSFGYGYNLADG